MKASRLLLGAVAAALAATPALAQKSKDTLRIGFYQPLRLVDTFYAPGPEASLATDMVFEYLLGYDAAKREYESALASSWKQIDPQTMELKIAKGVKWHDGEPFTVDDVLYTFQFATHPKTNYRFKSNRVDWIESFEKIDSETFRVRANTPTAIFEAKLKYFPPIYPKHIHEKFAIEEKNKFGLNPIGTGPYKVENLDPGNSILLVKNDAYSGSTPGHIGKVYIEAVPDEQTQVARMLTGEQDLMYNMDKEQALQFEKMPGFSVDVQDSVSFAYIMFDSKGRSGKTYFTDPKVRRAVLHAVNRKSLMRLVHPAIKRELSVVCHPWVRGCNWSVEPPQFDPAKAKQMLAEAGYPDGFDVEILTWGEARQTAEAVAGQLRQIGIRATVAARTFGAFVKTRAEGVPLIVTLWDNSVGEPDVDNTAGYFFLPNARNYNKDKELEKLALAGRAELNWDKRQALYREMFDKATERSYLMPLIPLPAIVVHSKDVKLLGGHKNPKGFEINRVTWN